MITMPSAHALGAYDGRLDVLQIGIQATILSGAYRSHRESFSAVRCIDGPLVALYPRMFISDVAAYGDDVGTEPYAWPFDDQTCAPKSEDIVDDGAGHLVAVARGLALCPLRAA